MFKVFCSYSCKFLRVVTVQGQAQKGAHMQQKFKSFGEQEAEQRKRNLSKQVKLKFWGH